MGEVRCQFSIHVVIRTDLQGKSARAHMARKEMQPGTYIGDAGGNSLMVRGWDGGLPPTE